MGEVNIKPTQKVNWKKCVSKTIRQNEKAVTIGLYPKGRFLPTDRKRADFPLP